MTLCFNVCVCVSVREMSSKPTALARGVLDGHASSAMVAASSEGLCLSVSLFVSFSRIHTQPLSLFISLSHTLSPSHTHCLCLSSTPAALARAVSDGHARSAMVAASSDGLCLSLSLSAYRSLAYTHKLSIAACLSLAHNKTVFLALSHTHSLSLSRSLTHTRTLFLSISLSHTHTLPPLSLSHTHTLSSTPAALARAVSDGHARSAMVAARSDGLCLYRSIFLFPSFAYTQTLFLRL